jgi:hypothetical protein
MTDEESSVSVISRYFHKSAKCLMYQQIKITVMMNNALLYSRGYKLVTEERL